MPANIRNLISCKLLVSAAAFLWLSGSAQSHTLTIIKNFGGADGAYPVGGVVLSEGVLYGATQGYAYVGATIFRVNIDGTGFRTLHTNLFNVGLEAQGLLVVGNALYGTTVYGGSENNGAIFRIDIDGNNFTNIYSFTTNNQSGFRPNPGLVLDGTNLFGTTSGGGVGYGTVFKIDTNGAGYSNFHVFTNGPDGKGPLTGLTLSKGLLYGVAFGSAGGFIVFKLNTDGSGFANGQSFSVGLPVSRLIISGDTLYGTGGYGGPDVPGGTVFKVNTDGNGFAVLRRLDWRPTGGLALLGYTLYGTGGDFYGPGRVYKINVDGSGLTMVYNFTNIVVPQGDLISSGGIVYGTTYEGGSGGGGTVFAFNPAIPLRAAVLNTNLVLSWDDPSFQLQSAPIVSGPYTNVPAATSPYTNGAIFPQQFFRLQHQ